MRNKGHKLHSIGLNKPLQNKLCKNVSHANKKLFALRNDIFPRFRMCVPILIFFGTRENCIVIADSAIRVLPILLTDFPSQFQLVIQ